MSIDDVEIGKRYKISFDDCCVQGFFTASVLSIEVIEDFVSSVTFDNGVTISGHGVFVENG